MGHKDLKNATERVERIEREIQQVTADAAAVKKQTHERHFREEYLIRLDELELELVGARAAIHRLQICKGAK